MITRRLLLQMLLAGGVAGAGTRICAEIAPEDALAQAHRELWRRFISDQGILLDYTDRTGACPTPTPEECAAGKPNALGWWTPTENGSMFNGMYLDGMVQRWQATQAAEDAAKAERLVRGLLRLSALGPPGFMARNVAADGRTTYPMGSNDQTGPGLYGLWRFLEAGLGTAALREEVKRRFLEVAEALRASGWRMPCQPGAPAPYRGSFAWHTWEDAPRLLFVVKAAHALSGAAEWQALYEKLAQEPGAEGLTRVQVCAQGMVFHRPGSRECWTGASSAIALRALWEMEEEPARRGAYAQGLAASLVLAAEGLALAKQLPSGKPAACLMDWRVLNEWWQPQRSEAEAVQVAETQNRHLGPQSPRRYQEFRFVREPAFAAWIVTLCPDTALVRPHREAVLEVVRGFDYRTLYYSQFFPVEAAYFRLLKAAG